MKICQMSNIFSVLTILALSAAVNCKVLDLEARSSDADSTIDNVVLPDSEKRPFLQLLGNMEAFIESSIHTLVENFITSNSSLMASVPEILSSPLHSFHNFTAHIEDLGDTVFQRQESIIHLVQCECPDERNQCNHILARRVPNPDDSGKRDAINRELKADDPVLPVVDVITLIRHFQRHFTGVMQTQRKVFEYAQCACPNKKKCMRSKASSGGGWFKNGDADDESGVNLEIEDDNASQTAVNAGSDNTDPATKESETKDNEVSDSSAPVDNKDISIKKRSILDTRFDLFTDDVPTQNNGEALKDSRIQKRSAENVGVPQRKGFFDEFLSWFSNIFSGFPQPQYYTVTYPNGTYFYNATYPNGTYIFSAHPNGTHFYNGTLANGAHYEGGEYHNGNANGYFVSTHKEDANGNFFSSSSSSSSSSSTFGK